MALPAPPGDAVSALQVRPAPAPVPSSTPTSPKDGPRRQRRHSLALPVPEAPKPAPALKCPAGPRTIEVEYIFGGAEPDEITLITAMEVLEPGDAVLTETDTRGQTTLGRARRFFAQKLNLSARRRLSSPVVDTSRR